MSALILEALTSNALREHLDWAERQYELAAYCESFERTQRERAYWLAQVRQIRAEIERRGEEWGGVWPQAQ